MSYLDDREWETLQCCREILRTRQHYAYKNNYDYFMGRCAILKMSCAHGLCRMFFLNVTIWSIQFHDTRWCRSSKLRIPFDVHDALHRADMEAKTRRVSADVPALIRTHHTAIHPTHMSAGRAAKWVPNAAHSFVEWQLHDVRRSSSSSMTAMIVIIVGVLEEIQRVPIFRYEAPQSWIWSVGGDRLGYVPLVALVTSHKHSCRYWVMKMQVIGVRKLRNSLDAGHGVGARTWE